MFVVRNVSLGPFDVKAYPNFNDVFFYTLALLSAVDIIIIVAMVHAGQQMKYEHSNTCTCA